MLGLLNDLYLILGPFFNYSNSRANVILTWVTKDLISLQKPNLILNVNGFIGVAMVDMLRKCGCFTT